MSIDLSQFIGDFLEESYEGLAAMEAALLDFNGSEEVVNTIFRAAHSIKGGAGTFGFEQVANFTHKVETLLDEVRKQRQSMSRTNVNLLLQSVDIIREMLDVAQEGELDPSKVSAVEASLEAVLQGNQAVSDEPAAPEVVQEETATSGWQISFIPEPDLLQGGNEPSYLFEALQDLGELTIEADISALPEAQSYQCRDLYISWQLRLASPCEREEVEEIFEWVEDCCELSITPLQSPAQDSLEELTQALEQVQLESAAVVEPAPRPETTPAKGESARASFGESSSVRVEIEKIDALMNRVGELVITQAMLSQAGEVLAKQGVVNDALSAGLSQLERNTRDLQEDVMRVRMLPISFVFNRFPRLVHDASGKLGKKVELVINGAQTEIDKTVMEKIGDPLVHLVRNALDHGLETPQERLEAGKSEQGCIELSAYHQNGFIVIDIIDDGRGLNIDKIKAKAVERGLITSDQSLSDQEANELIFKAGFSTAEQVSDLSGRGVGMDVVRRNIESLGGQVSIESRRGEGSKISVRLPLTLAILEGQLIKAEDEVFIVPLVAIIETVLADKSLIKSIGSDSQLFNFRDEYIHLISLKKVLSLHRGDSEDNVLAFSAGQQQRLVIVVESGGKKVGLVVDELLGQQQVVVKSLEVNFKRVQGLLGGTILGDGSVSLILDVAGLMSLDDAHNQRMRLRKCQ
ncbi:MAG: chemotaxis protein CheA [Pseudomonadales bacterium]